MSFISYSQIKYEVVSEKAYFYTPSVLDGNASNKSYLVEGDYTRCSETKTFWMREDLETFGDDFCFCWFKRKGIITTGYLYRSTLTYEEKDRGDWYSLKNIYRVKQKRSYFYLPEQLSIEGPYLVRGDVAICDKKTIWIKGKEFCFCDFRKESGSSQGRITSGYLEKSKLVRW